MPLVLPDPRYEESTRRHNLLVQALGGALGAGAAGFVGGLEKGRARKQALSDEERRRQLALSDLASGREFERETLGIKERGLMERARLKLKPAPTGLETLAKDPRFVMALKRAVEPGGDQTTRALAMQVVEAAMAGEPIGGAHEVPGVPARPSTPSTIVGGPPERLSVSPTMGEAAERVRAREHPLTYEQEDPFWPYSRGVALGTGTARPSLLGEKLRPPSPSPVVAPGGPGAPAVPGRPARPSLMTGVTESMRGEQERELSLAGGKEERRVKARFPLEMKKAELVADRILTREELQGARDADKARLRNTEKKWASLIADAKANNPELVPNLLNNQATEMARIVEEIKAQAATRIGEARARGRPSVPRTRTSTRTPGQIVEGVLGGR